jgi:hypothetical protein
MLELKELVGEHVLFGVDQSSKAVKEEYGDGFEDCQIIRFQLGKIVYQCIEDPSDGYRSSMREIRLSKEPIKNRFKGVKVIGKHSDKGEDILELIDVKTGKTVLMVGTDNSDDYYPSFVASFQPENMWINRERKS